MAVELEPAVVAVPAAVVDLVAAELVVADPVPAAEADLAGDQAAGDLVAAEQAVAAGVEPALVLLQGQALARVQQPRSALALTPHMARVRLAVPEWVPVCP